MPRPQWCLKFGPRGYHRGAPVTVCAAAGKSQGKETTKADTRRGSPTATEPQARARDIRRGAPVTMLVAPGSPERKEMTKADARRGTPTATESQARARDLRRGASVAEIESPGPPSEPNNGKQLPSV